MFWKKKKGLIDVGEMHRRGLITAPKQDPNVEKFRMSKEGYVEMREEAKAVPLQETKTSNGFASFFGFGDSSSSQESANSISTSSGVMDLPGTGQSGFFSDNSSTSSSKMNAEVYEKREVDERVEKLDNLIYKLEQRIEVLERKLGTNSTW